MATRLTPDELPEADAAQAVLDALEDPTVVLDGTGMVVTANRAWRTEWAASPMPAFGETGVDYLDVVRALDDGTGADDLIAALCAVLRGERRSFTADVPVRVNDAIGWRNLRAMARQDGPGAVIIHVDITSRVAHEADLRRSRRHHQAVVERAADPVVVLDGEGRFRSVPPSVTGIFGWAPEELEGLSCLQLLHPDDIAQVEALFREAQPATAPLHDLHRVRHRDGSYRYVEAASTNLLDDPDVRGVVVSLRDVTERVVLEQQLASQASLLRHLAEGRPLAELLQEMTDRVQASMPGTRVGVVLVEGERIGPQAFGALPAGFLQLVVREGLSGGTPYGLAVRGGEALVVSDVLTDRRFADDVPHAIAAGIRATVSIPLHHSTQLDRVVGILTVWWSAPHPVTDQELRQLHAWADVASIAIERSQAEERLAHQATHDPLTGLANRHLFDDRLRAALRAARRTGTSVGVLFLDLDRFKIVNDSLGHDHGDELLVDVAGRLLDGVRPLDTVARFGGDEFVVCLPDVTGPDDALAVAARLQAAMREPFSLRGRTARLGASIGVAVGRAGDDPLRLVADADSAAYEAKNRGRDRVILFDQRLRTMAQRRLDVEADLRAALDGDELRCWFQPILTVERSGSVPALQVVGAEALARWIRPDGSTVSPAEFIPVAEESGLVVPLGRRLLEQACATARDWLDQLGATAPRVSVNLSPAQLRHERLVEDVAAALEQSGLPPDHLTLELTETSLVDADVLPLLARLRELGVSLALDDFGTGYSSLAYVQRLPLDTLKVDRSFVRGMGKGDAASAAIAHAVVSLARSLGLVVCAEGVETPGELLAVGGLGCQLAQGFLFSPPVPVEQFPLTVQVPLA